jgi:3-hexulose-6-phosphate synthase
VKLQLALDLVTLEEALRAVGELDGLVDHVEIGTPLVIREGVRAVAAVKERFPRLTVVADVKIADGGEPEARLAFEAGADIVTVLGWAHDATLDAAVREAGRWGRQVMVDLLGMSDPAHRAAEAERMGAGWVCVHTASDLAAAGHSAGGRGPLDDLARTREAVRTAKVAVAGGIRVETVREIARLGPDLIIVGSAVMGSPDRRETVRRIREEAGP